MGDTLIHEPSGGHRCDVGWSERPVMLPSMPLDPTAPTPVMLRGRWDPPGTVRRCDECRQFWVAREVYQRPGGGYSSERIVWRREGRLARWWREQFTSSLGDAETTVRETNT